MQTPKKGWSSQRLQVMHGISGGTDPRQNDHLGIEHILGAAGHLRSVAQSADSINHAAQIPRTIINDGNHLEPFSLCTDEDSVMDSNFYDVFPGDSFFLIALSDENMHQSHDFILSIA
jgi:hypothetical protein